MEQLQRLNEGILNSYEKTCIEIELTKIKCRELKKSLDWIKEQENPPDVDDDTVASSAVINDDADHKIESELSRALERARIIRDAQVKEVAPPIEPPPPAISAAAEAKKPRSIKLPSRILQAFDALENNVVSSSKATTTFINGLETAISRQHRPLAPHPIVLSFAQQYEAIERTYTSLFRIITHFLSQEYVSNILSNTGDSHLKLFPTWYRFNRVYKILAEVNDELDFVLAKFPRPPEPNRDNPFDDFMDFLKEEEVEEAPTIDENNEVPLDFKEFLYEYRKEIHEELNEDCDPKVFQLLHSIIMCNGKRRPSIVRNIS